MQLKASDELIVSVTAIALVVSVFQGSLPPLADIRADEKSNINTHKTTKMAAITSAAIVGTVALVAKSPTVFIIGGGAILFETWKNHFANHGANGTQENAAATAVG